MAASSDEDEEEGSVEVVSDVHASSSDEESVDEGFTASVFASDEEDDLDSSMDNNRLASNTDDDGHEKFELSPTAELCKYVACYLDERNHMDLDAADKLSSVVWDKELHVPVKSRLERSNSAAAADLSYDHTHNRRRSHSDSQYKQPTSSRSSIESYYVETSQPSSLKSKSMSSYDRHEALIIDDDVAHPHRSHVTLAAPIIKKIGKRSPFLTTCQVFPQNLPKAR